MSEEKKEIIKNLSPEQRKILVERLAAYLYAKEKEEQRFKDLSKI